MPSTHNPNTGKPQQRDIAREAGKTDATRQHNKHTTDDPRQADELERMNPREENPVDDPTKGQRIPDDEEPTEEMDMETGTTRQRNN